MNRPTRPTDKNAKQEDDEKYLDHQAGETTSPEPKPKPAVPTRPSPSRPSSIPLGSTSSTAATVATTNPPVSHVPPQPTAHTFLPLYPSSAPPSSDRPCPSEFEHNYSAEDVPDREFTETRIQPNLAKIHEQNLQSVRTGPNHLAAAVAAAPVAATPAAAAPAPAAPAARPPLPPETHPIDIRYSDGSLRTSEGHLVIGYHADGKPIVMVDEVGKLTHASPVSHSSQVYYPIFLGVLLAAMLIMAFVPQWEKSTFREYKALQPLLLTSFVLLVLCTACAAAHSIILLISGRSLWHNSAKLRTGTTTAYYSINLILLSLAIIFFATCLVIMFVKFNHFHQQISKLGAVSWWCAGCLAAPIYAYLFIRFTVDLIQVQRRPPAAPRVPKDPYAQPQRATV